jgi:hypothetical protein
MITATMKKTGFLLAALVILAGCQSAPRAAQMDTLNSGFMSLWATYQRCETGSDVEAMQADAVHLSRMAQQPIAGMDTDIPLPQMIRRFVSEPANRLAVDPKAMAAHCSLQTGLVALSAGRHDVADRMFRSVMTYPEPAYSYYVNRARAGLAVITASVTSTQDVSSIAAPETPPFRFVSAQ